MKRIPYKDIADDPEDDRIKQIGELVMKTKKIVGFITDDELDKPERYIRKLQKRFPGILVLHKGPGPVKKTILVKVGPPAN